MEPESMIDRPVTHLEVFSFVSLEAKCIREECCFIPTWLLTTMCRDIVSPRLVVNRVVIVGGD